MGKCVILHFGGPGGRKNGVLILHPFLDPFFGGFLGNLGKIGDFGVFRGFWGNPGFLVRWREIIIRNQKI